MGKGSAAGMWMRTSHSESLRPAARTRTLLAGSAESRFANAQPAEPPPTMTKSFGTDVIAQLTPVPASQALTLSGLALVHLKFLTRVKAGLPEVANLVLTTLFRLYSG